MNVAPPDAPSSDETARQAAELAALLRMIDASRGSFSLSFAVCNSGELRDYVTARIQQTHPAVEAVSVPPKTVDVFGAVKNAAANPERTALFIINLEHSIDAAAEDHPTLRSLNASRELWEQQFRCPVVFWLPEFAAALVSREARDFWRYRSHRFEFVSERTAPAAALSDQSGWSLPLVEAMDVDEKNFRVAELESRLAQVGPNPPSELAPHFWAWIDELAYLYYSLARFADAEPLLRRTLELYERARGPNHPEIAVCLNNLANLLQATNRLAEAEPLLRRALEIQTTTDGPQAPSIAVRLNNLAQLLRDTNRLTEAEPLMRRALDIDETGYGPNHPDVARDLNNLATLLETSNRHVEAEPLLRRALGIWEKSHTKTHPRVAGALTNLAHLLQRTNRVADAEPLLHRALEIDERFYGPNHPGVARDLNNLAQLLQRTNRLAAAEPHLRRALDIAEKSYGPNHPSVATVLNNLGLLLQRTNRLAQAEPFMRRNVEILRDFTRTTGHQDPNAQTAMRNYRALLEAMNLPAPEIAARLRALTP